MACREFSDLLDNRHYLPIILFVRFTRFTVSPESRVKDSDMIFHNITFGIF